MSKKKKKKKKAKPKIEQVKTEPELSETPVIEGEQATAPAKPKSATITRPEVEVKLKQDGGYEVKPSPSAEDMIIPGGPVEGNIGKVKSFDDLPSQGRPKVGPPAIKTKPVVPIMCAACKGIFDLSGMSTCVKCGMRYCRICSTPGTCHSCGKGLK